jgi:formate/nitrite transporter FocA (FNT family)
MINPNHCVCVCFFMGGGRDLNAIFIIMSIIMIASSFNHCIRKLKSILVLNEGSKKDLGS